MADPASFPEKTHYTVEPHGQGWAIYRGRDFEHHGLNLGQLTECLPETALLVQRALNALDDPSTDRAEGVEYHAKLTGRVSPELQPADVDEATAHRLDARAAARAYFLGDKWEHMGEAAREAMRQRVRDEEGTA